MCVCVCVCVCVYGLLVIKQLCAENKKLRYMSGSLTSQTFHPVGFGLRDYMSGYVLVAK